MLMAATISAVMLTPTEMDVNPHIRKSRNLAVPCNVSTSSSVSGKRKLPILLFDIMDTVVRDPFYHDVPAFFRMSMKELIEWKHPMAWIEFEEGSIDEEELARKFFKDGRNFDLEGLKDCMRLGYSYLDGMQDLLHALNQNNYEMHALTNYPIWYQMIEDKLELSAYLSWTFCSCKMGILLSSLLPFQQSIKILSIIFRIQCRTFRQSLAESSYHLHQLPLTGKRKPDPEFYLDAARHLEVEPCNCIFIDDRLKNVDSATQVGMVGLHFRNADSLRQDLSRHGIDISINKNDGL